VANKEDPAIVLLQHLWSLCVPFYVRFYRPR